MTIKRSKMFALMEQSWQEATKDWPNGRKLTDAVWSLDDMLRAWLRDWPTDDEMRGYTQWDFMTIMQDEVMNIFQRDLAKEVLAGNITREDCEFAHRVIMRYQTLCQKEAAKSPKRSVNDVAWSDNGTSWEHAPATTVFSFSGLWETATTVMFMMERQGGGRVRLTTGTAEDNETREFDNGQDLVRWLYDGERDVRMAALRLLLFRMEDEWMDTHPDEDFKKFFGDAQRQFFTLPWPVQSHYLYRGILMVTDVELAQDAMKDGEDE